MLNEILVLKATLADCEEQYIQLTLQADNHIISIRESLNVYEEDFTNLPVDRSLQAMKDLYSVWQKANKLKERIARMKKDLGIKDSTL